MHDPGREVETQAFQQALLAELDRRLAEFATYDDNTFGRITAREAWLAAAMCVGMPLLCVWFFA
jgi:hypothetical protein